MITMEIPMNGGLCGPPHHLGGGGPPHHGGSMGQITSLEYDHSKGDDKKKNRECKYI